MAVETGSFHVSRGLCRVVCIGVCAGSTVGCHGSATVPLQTRLPEEPPVVLRPGSLDGYVLLNGTPYDAVGMWASDGAFRLDIARNAAGDVAGTEGYAQVVASLAPGEWTTTGLVVGEGCGEASPSEFCGATTPAEVALDPHDPVIRIQPDDPAAAPMEFHFESPGFFATNLGGVFDVQHAEVTGGGTAVMSIDSQGRLFLQSPDTGCTANGVLTPHTVGDSALYDVRLTLSACVGSAGYLNADYEGFSTSVRVQGAYGGFMDDLVLWLATRADATPSNALTLYASDGAGYWDY